MYGLKGKENFLILPFDYHNKKEYFLLSYKTLFTSNDWVLPKGIKIIERKGSRIVDLSYNYATSQEVWRFNINDIPGQWVELKLTKKYFDECKLEVEDESSAKLLFELER